MFLLAPPSPSPSTPDYYSSPDVKKACDENVLCDRIVDWTGSQWLGNSSYVVVIKPLRIIGIILVAMLIRWLLHRAISRLASSTSRASMPALLRPLREKVTVTAEEGQFIPERRRQRAEAIGSVLRSFVSAVVFTMAALLVMGELGFNLGPLLASAGIVGVALGFGAQSLVKDLIAGLFMLLEDQYGVGDTVDLGEATGVVESVGLRITTVRDARGVLWYIRNGEIVRVGNKSQGWAMVVIDIPIGFVSSEEAVAVLRTAAGSVATEPEHQTEFLEPPEVIGVEQLTVDGAVIRTIAKTTADSQVVIQRDLRRALTEALETSGLSERIAASRLLPRSAVPPAWLGGGENSSPTPTDPQRPGGAT
ncbi:small conductance mechanosensitive channel [Actinoplanes campanulatus]|uniref:Small conductance mechanosensitive channel n=1 Tax=Actinoplanes campanulatus TaxID=113559 RepID=A0A7W5FK56_9ACTN|nr:small conductance mechanosensitive channel [Actinoplanes campanulatus]GGN48526.1 mechanosensitive ion channel protein MscS [Actinoplanes campanulatus]GID41711.1 mechanosensitive ion channel protein MscS [Actinoplanes campanulatus]